MPSFEEVLAMSREDTFLVDAILPKGYIHLVVGPSGVGKTTWLLQMLNDWCVGKPVLGFRTFPLKSDEWAYISGDRSLRDLSKTMNRLGVNLPNVYMDSVVDNKNIQDIDDVLMRSKRLQLVILDGMAGFVSDTNKYKVVRDFLGVLNDWCERTGRYEGGEGFKRSMMATMHSPKQKEKDRYMMGRDQILGSVAWGGYVSSIIVLHHKLDKQGVAGKIRLVTVEPRNAEPFTIQYAMGATGLVAQQEEAEAGRSLRLWSFLEGRGVGREFARPELLDYLSEGESLSRGQMDWILKGLVADAYITMSKKGLYTIVKTSGGVLGEELPEPDSGVGWDEDGK